MFSGKIQYALSPFSFHRSTGNIIETDYLW